MKKDFKQFTAGTSGDHYYYYSAVPGIGEAIVFNNVFNKLANVNVSKAFIKINCEYSVNELHVYWDKTGELTDFNNIDTNPNVVKLDYSGSGYTYMTFDVTRVFAEFQKAGTPLKNQRIIVTGISFIVQEDEPEYSISVYYDYKRTVIESKATVPFELSSANASIDLSDKSVRLSYAANKGFGRLPVSVNFYYDSNLTNDVERIYLENNSYKEIDYCCGNGWKHNFQQYIIADRSTTLHGDGETFGYYTWINGQGGHIVFSEKYYAVINGRNRYLNKSQVLFDVDKNMTYVESGVTYPVFHSVTSDTNYTLTITQDEISNEYYYKVSDIIGNAFSFCEMLDTNVASLRNVFDNYDNQISLVYDVNEKLVTVKSQTRNEQNVLVDLNVVNLSYNQVGKLYQVSELLDDNSTITTTLTMSPNNSLLLGFVSPENHRDVTFTYYANNYFKTVLDSIGNGFYIEVTSSYTKLHSIAKNAGIVNGEIVPLTDTNKTKVIDGVRYKYVEIYKITYSDLSAQLELIRDKEKMSYLFDWYGRCISQYANNYDGEGLGNLQGEMFVTTGENIKIGVQNVFESNDLCQDATYSASSISDIGTVGTSEERSKLVDFATKMSTKAGTNKNVYYADSSSSSSTISISLSSSAISNIKLSTSTDFIISGWAMAKSFPIIAHARGYIVGHRLEKVLYSTSKEAMEFNSECDGYRTNRNFSLCASISYSSSTGTITDLFKASFDANNTNFQYLQIPVRLRKNNISQISAVSVCLDYNNNNGRIYLYGVAMKAGSWSFEKYNNDKMVTYSKNAEQANYYSESYYNSNKLLSESYVKEENNEVDEFSVTYNYNSHNDMILLLDSEGFAEENIYNGKGDLLKNKKYRKYDAYDSYAFISESTYDALTGDELTANSPFGDLAITKTYSHGALSTKLPALSATIAYGYDDALNLVKSLTAQTEPPIVANNTYLKGTTLTNSDSGSHYAYDYDGFGRVTAIKIDGEAYCAIEYKNENEKIVTYANNEKERTKTDSDDKELSVYCTDRNGQGGGNTAIEMKMSSYGTFKDLIDEMSGGTKYKAEYDDCGRPLKSVVENKQDSYFDVTVKREYDKNGVITTQTVEHDAIDIDEVSYTYEDKYEGKLTQAEHSIIGDENQTFDELDRVFSVSKFNESFKRVISYHENGDEGKNITCNLVACDEFMVDDSLADKDTYFYDALSRLTEVRKSNIIHRKYAYDLVGRLAREDNRDLNKTFTYAYDLAGNILSRKEYDFTLDSTLPSTPVATIPYAYDSTHKDRLTGYNGQTVGGYEIGNPWTYRGKAATWKNVNRLASYDGITFDYNYSGIRTKKTVNGITTKYAINDSNIISEQKGTDATSRITYFYGIDGVTAFKYAEATYYYKKNFLGDILGIYNSSKQFVAKYVYDAWGNHKVYALINNAFVDVTGHTITSGTTVNEQAALSNPFRYRSYYFDSETGFYYLQSRYYDPQVGRFLNMDSIENLNEATVNGINVYAYCCNDPVNNADPEGTWLHILIGAAVGAIAGVVGQAISDVVTTVVTGKKTVSSWQSYLGAAVGGAVGGAIGAAIGNPTAARVAENAVTGFVSTTASMAFNNMAGNTDYTFGEIMGNALIDSAVSVGLGEVVNVKKVNKGKGNMASTYRAGLTKIKGHINGVRKMSLRVMGKGLLSKIVLNIPMNIYSGIKAAVYPGFRLKYLMSILYPVRGNTDGRQYITAR